jgi:hypothetical protein
VLVDGVGGGALVEALVPRLAVAGRPPLRVRAGDFLRPAGERFEHGREDPDALRTTWLDAAALTREVLDAAVQRGTYLPRLWDADADRSARAHAVPAPARSVLLVDGVFLLGRGLPAEFTVHVTLSPAALRRRGVPEWHMPAFAGYDADVRPGDVCDVLVRAEDPRRPALLFRH